MGEGDGGRGTGGRGDGGRGTGGTGGGGKTAVMIQRGDGGADGRFAFITHNFDHSACHSCPVFRLFCTLET